MKNLFESLKQAGQEPINIKNKVLVLPFSARVLGLYPDGKTNQFWVNDELYNGETTRSFLAGKGWINIGGDRTWISPEIETLVEDPKLYPAAIDVPKTVDPGAYKVKEVDETSVVLESDMNVCFHQTKKNIKMKVTKQVILIEESPLQLPEQVHFAGYYLNCALTITESVTGPMRPGLWNLIQVPGGGKIFIPVKPGVEPRAFINNPVYKLEGNIITCAVETDTRFKYSIKASYSKGLMVYLNSGKEKASLVVRKFNVEDESSYAEYPSYDASDDGYMTEIYIDDGQLGGFGELEYHSPAIDISNGGTEIKDSNETWAFSGSVEKVKEICDSLLEGIS